MKEIIIFVYPLSQNYLVDVNPNFQETRFYLRENDIFDIKETSKNFITLVADKEKRFLPDSYETLKFKDNFNFGTILKAKILFEEVSTYNNIKHYTKFLRIKYNYNSFIFKIQSTNAKDQYLLKDDWLINKYNKYKLNRKSNNQRLRKKN